MQLIDATAEDIEKSFALYHEMIKIMTAVDNKAPAGSCCGKNKKQHINTFITNKEKYINRMNAIKNRKIRPLWHGILFVSKLGKHFNSETITDEESLKLIEVGALKADKYFDLSNYEQPVEIPTEEVKVEKGFEKYEEEYKAFVNDLKEKQTKFEVIFEEVNEPIDEEIKEAKPKKARKPRKKK